MQRYDSYKDSGIQWLGEIPSHWEVCKIKNVSQISSGSTPKSSIERYWGGGIKWITPADFKTDTKYVCKGMRDITEAGALSCSTKLIPKNSVVFSKRAPVGQVSITTDDLCINQGCIACIPNESIITPFFFYLLSCYKDEFESLSGGTTFKEIALNVFADFKISIPPLPEQQAIASYLDTATAKIDEAIVQQQKMIDLLNERKQIIINNAVTKGLNPNAKMKPSGIDWIGNIPEHWEMVRLGYCAWIRARLGWKGLKADEYVENGYPFLSAFNIQNNKLDWNSLNYINKQRYEESPEIKLKIGDILLVKDGAGIGKCARVDSLPMGESTANGSLAFITSNEGVDYKFLYYFIISDSFKKNTFNLVNGMGVPHLTQGEMKKTLIPIPLKKEQMEISSYLDGEVEKIENVIMCHEKQISFLLERKQIIINDIVTGKVKVC